MWKRTLYRKVCQLAIWLISIYVPTATAGCTVIGAFYYTPVSLGICGAAYGVVVALIHSTSPTQDHDY